ncbi:low density lipoprotein receptor adapter protein 1 isoform X2 [Amphiprion ocellaris]|uniref:low density lipoprotein receptor adapter protein 1 isoform X2 n=1 Tax=Amphiprion ocellaris TaxID=80972 RepID=UPI002410CF65|nr:low density lipoprotein receptor adapter protein 1 isoform X2 [Amphiprion ocellaris]
MYSPWPGDEEKHLPESGHAAGWTPSNPPAERSSRAPEFRGTRGEPQSMKARASAKKFRKVTLTVSPKGIIITDTETADLIENVSIYRISYCTADKTQDKVFAYVSQCEFNETLECHAFLCHKRKIAQAVTLTVAQAFKVALDLWEIAQEDKSRKSRNCSSCAASDGQSETTEAQCVPAD